MEVKLINYSQADGEYLIDSTSAQEMVAFCARVSNPDNQMLGHDIVGNPAGQIDFGTACCIHNIHETHWPYGLLTRFD